MEIKTPFLSISLDQWEIDLGIIISLAGKYYKYFLRTKEVGR